MKYEILQCSLLVHFSRFWPDPDFFLKKLVWKKSGFTPKSPDLTKNGRKNAENWFFEHTFNDALDAL